jgi:uncharacterized protein (TIGR03067 family)
MKKFAPAVAAFAWGGSLLFCAPVFAADIEAGFNRLFNGKDLTGWAGRPNHWSVQDGCITGVTTKDNPAKGNNFLIAKIDGTNLVVDDFELRLNYKIVPNNEKGFGNSGIQYRSREFPNFVVRGYQADFEAGKIYSGILYEEGGRGILAERGQKVVIKENADKPGQAKIEVTGSLGKSSDLQAAIKTEDWNEYVVIARGNHLQHFINGHQTVDVIDEQSEKAAKSGILALQLHAGEPMTVQFKDIRIKKLSGDSAKRSDLELMQGAWVPTEIIANGKPTDAEVLAAVKMKIKDNGYTSERPKGEDKGTFRLDETTTPRAMDLTTGSGVEVRAIYEISGDAFKACYAVRDAARPTEFKSAEDSNHILVVYKRRQD